jgi:pyrimidine-nucleoside phosphorylase
MNVVELIERKRDGGRVEAAEWRTLMRAYAADEVPDYQMSALAMAILFQGMEDDEIEALTTAMLESGRMLELGHLKVPRIDKHSTGGVGDKVSLILAPLVAACGIAVPMMSGRGLGHTGGTLDKLESIPGFRTRLSLEETAAQVARLNVAMIGQTKEIAPADRKFYSLRDATATVEAIPLIAASIMSKKLAEGLTGLVLDVKTGAGAFMPKIEDAIKLAHTMIALGERRGCPTVALLTDMDAPLGVACGNALEVEESVLCLRDEGPADLREVTLALSAEMLLVAKIVRTEPEARKMLETALASGAALEKFRAIVRAQGGDERVVDDPRAVLPQAKLVKVLLAEQAGVAERVEPRVVGRAIIALGGGRTKVSDEIDPSVGVMMHVRPGAKVERGAPLATIHARDEATQAAAEEMLRRAIRVGETPPPERPLVSHRITSRGVEELTFAGAS